jgi:hypothetical protein
MTDGVDWKRVPGAKRPEGSIPVRPPYEVGGFRFARTDDGAQEDGSPRVSPERGYVTDPTERLRLLGYLTGGALVRETMRYGTDRVDPTRRFAVQVAYRTDGVWVWPASVEYYLRHHNFGLEPDFRRHVEAQGYRVAQVPAEVVDRAREATLQRARIREQRIAEYRAAHQESEPPDDGRFEPEVRQRLLGLGWKPGRDVREKADAWLAEWVDELAELPFERDGYPRYEPIPAALKVLYEFGGLYSVANGSGLTSAQIPFDIYPNGRTDDLASFAVDVQLLGDRIRRRVFQVGDIERRMGALVVDELGRVFAVGPAEHYLGENIEEALTRMVRGIRPQYLTEVGL